MHVLRPKDVNELAQVIKDASDARVPLEIAGTGSKRGIGRPVIAEHIVCSSSMFGITQYRPGERILSVKAGTPIQFIENTLARNNQMLPFEPMNLAKNFNEPEDTGTIAGVISSNLCGSRRILAGSAQDHFLGMEAVNGMGKIIKAGGQVMKNVTGYDVCRGIAGSWGTLVYMTDISLRVMPKPEVTKTLIFKGVLDVLAVELMGKAMKTPYEVSGAAHLQSPLVTELSDLELSGVGQSLTAIRIENFEAAVSYRIEKLKDILGSFGEMIVLDNERSLQFWSDMCTLKFFQQSKAPFWRITTAPSKGAEVVAAIKSHHPDCVAAYDWSGGLIWLLTPFRKDAGASEVHRTVVNRGGNATLIRGSADLRKSAYVFQPIENNVKNLMKKIKMAFDPMGILNPGRIYADI